MVIARMWERANPLVLRIKTGRLSVGKLSMGVCTDLTAKDPSESSGAVRRWLPELLITGNPTSFGAATRVTHVWNSQILCIHSGIIAQGSMENSGNYCPQTHIYVHVYSILFLILKWGWIECQRKNMFLGFYSNNNDVIINFSSFFSFSSIFI